MLSIILYGRNDHHGYQLQKRLAISLNALAMLLGEPDDEIIFVDYNTPHHLPTITEAIEDTLTSHCLKFLKTLRVRPEIHHKFKTHLNVNEPLARNIAICRTNPNNEWLLSTNGDILLLLKRFKKFAQLLPALKHALYLIPRFDLPETLWETLFNRQEPEDNLFLIETYAKQWALNLSVTHKFPYLRYDNPGDFQLMPRKWWFEMSGFNELMTVGWHVDANLNKRVYLLNKPILSLKTHIASYHCNHTRAHSIAHQPHIKRNDWRESVLNVKSAKLNQPNWGRPTEIIETILHNPSRRKQYLKKLGKLLPKDVNYPDDYLIEPASFNPLIYSTTHAAVFIMDHLYHLPAKSTIIYLGSNQTLKFLLKKFLDQQSQQLLTFSPGNAKKLKSILLSSHLILFDFGFDSAEKKEKTFLQMKLEIQKLALDLITVAKTLNKHRSNHRPCLSINLTRHEYKLLFVHYFDTLITGYATNVLLGFPKNRTFCKSFIALFKFTKYKDQLKRLLVEYSLKKNGILLKGIKNKLVNNYLVKQFRDSTLPR